MPLLQKETCNECPLKHLDKEVGYRRGSSNDILIVGQSPAAHEIRRGEPFVGPSGVLLKNVIARAGMEEREFTLTNALRCMEGIPGLSGKRLTTALKSCRCNLDGAIRIIKPKLIVTLGANALKTIMNKGNVQQNRGRFFRSEEYDCDVFVMLHPAAIMRKAAPQYPGTDLEDMNPMEKTFLQDWRTVRRYINNDYTRPSGHDLSRYVEATLENITVLVDKAKRMGRVAIDLETNGLNPRDPQTRILSISLSVEEGSSVVHLFDNPLPSDRLIEDSIRTLLEDPWVAKIVAARPFDEKFIEHKLGYKVQGTIHDVLTIGHVKDENYHTFSLETMASVYAGMENIKSVAQGLRHNLAGADKQLIIEYNGIDTDATLRVFNALQDVVNSTYYQSFILPVMGMLARVSENGCLIDREALERNREDATSLLDSLVERFMQHVTPSVYTKHEEKGHQLSRNSFLRDVLFSPEGLGIKPMEKYKTETTNEPQLTEEHLKELLRVRDRLTASQRRAIEILLDWKKLNKISTSYLATLPTSIQADGRIYPSTTLTRTVTGRSVMLNPAIQTYPSRGQYSRLIREAIVADEGYQLMAFDLAQSELRIMGWLAEDQAILKALTDGVDLHTLTAAMVNGIPVDQVTEEHRTLAKGVNFGLIYGMQTPNFQEYLRENYNIRLPIEECERIRREFFRTYAGVAKYHVSVRRKLEREGQVVSPLGRIRHLPGISSPDYKDQAEAGRQAINSPIQSFSSDLGLLAMTIIHRKIQSMGLDARVMWFIHDAVVLQARTEDVPAVNDLIHTAVSRDTVQYIKEHFSLDVGYPVACDVKVGPNWAAMIKYNKWIDRDKDKNAIIL